MSWSRVLRGTPNGGSVGRGRDITLLWLREGDDEEGESVGEGSNTKDRIGRIGSLELG